MSTLPYQQIPGDSLLPDELRQAHIAAMVCALVALAVYAVTIGGTFVYDDKILDLDPRYANPYEWYRFWNDQYWPHGIDNLYRPLTCMTLAVQKWLHGDLAWPYHLVNWLLHGAISATVALLAHRLCNLKAAWVAGLLFAAHPIHVEVVSGIVGRLDLMCTLPMLMAMYFFLHPMSATRVVGIVICFVWTLLSKESGMLLPLILLAMIPLRQRILPSRPPADRKLMRGLFVSLCWILAGYLIFRESILRFWWPRSLLYWTGNPLVRSEGIDRLLMPLVLLGRYAALLIAPIHLSVDYGSMVIGWQVNYHQPYIYLGIAAVIFAAALFAWSILERRWEIFALLAAFGLTYGLVSNSITLIGTIFGERLMYLPSAFLLILLGNVASKLRTKHLTILLMIVTMIASVHTCVLARLWNDPLKLFTREMTEQPRSLELYDLVREQYALRGDNHAAHRVGHLCIANLPDVFEAYMLCADTAIADHDLDDAKRVADEGYARFNNAEMRAWVNKIRDLRAGKS